MSWVRLFEAAALAQALRDAGYQVSDRTVQRWKAGQSQPKPQDIAAILKLVGTTKEAAPDWERLEAKVDAIARAVGVSAEDAATRSARAALGQSPPLEGDGGPPAPSVPGSART